MADPRYENPIAAALGITAPSRRCVLVISGCTYDYHPASRRRWVMEAMHRIGGAQEGSSNASFSLPPAASNQHAHLLGVYLAGGSHRSNQVTVTRAAAQVALARAQQTVKGMRATWDMNLLVAPWR